MNLCSEFPLKSGFWKFCHLRGFARTATIYTGPLRKKLFQANLPDTDTCLTCVPLLTVLNFLLKQKRPHSWKQYLIRLYKHHNTLKYLVGVSPNLTTTFVSAACGAQLRHSGLWISGQIGWIRSHYGRQRVFNTGVLLYQAHNSVYTTWKTWQYTMNTAAVLKICRIANLSILVEQVIRRLKTFKIMSSEMPITVVPFAFKIIVVCAVLCNLRNPLYNN